MNSSKLPKRVFNSPLIRGVNFKDGSFINLIKLIKPYANGFSYAIHNTTESKTCLSGLFKTLSKANDKFNLIVTEYSKIIEIRNKFDREEII